MYFTKTSSSYRAWFSIASGGELITNISSGSFIVTLINKNDTSATSSMVTQSLQKPGIYRFDIPSEFLLSNGIGNYGICVEVNQMIAPTVIDVFSKVLQVSQEDFDSLSGSIWGTNNGLFNISGTMGYLENQIGTTSISASVAVDIPSIVSGVWNANASTFNTESSTGWLQNKISSISSSIQSVTVSLGSINAIVDAVWNADNSLYVITGSTGFNIDAIATKVAELHQIMGLEANSVLTVSTTNRTVANITQSFTGDPLVEMTVTRI